jgi:hypothetical protein
MPDSNLPHWHQSCDQDTKQKYSECGFAASRRPHPFLRGADNVCRCEECTKPTFSSKFEQAALLRRGGHGFNNPTHHILPLGEILMVQSLIREVTVVRMLPNGDHYCRRLEQRLKHRGTGHGSPFPHSQRRHSPFRLNGCRGLLEKFAVRVGTPVVALTQKVDMHPIERPKLAELVLKVSLQVADQVLGLLIWHVPHRQVGLQQGGPSAGKQSFDDAMSDGFTI